MIFQKILKLGENEILDMHIAYFLLALNFLAIRIHFHHVRRKITI